MKTQTLLIYFFFSLLVSFSCEASTRSLKIEDDGFDGWDYDSGVDRYATMNIGLKINL